MGGTIGAESEPGRGSTFWFELPLPQGVASAAQPPRKRITQRGERRGELRGELRDPNSPLVLVVEDSPVNRLVAVRVLERCGFTRARRQRRARSAPGALDADLRRRPDGLPDAGDGRLRGDQGAAPPRERGPPHAGDRDDGTRDDRRSRAMPGRRAWTTTSPSRCARRRSSRCCDAGSTQRTSPRGSGRRSEQPVAGNLSLGPERAGRDRRAPPIKPNQLGRLCRLIV